MKWLLIALIVITKIAAIYILGFFFLFIGWAFSGPGYTGQPLFLLGIALLVGAIVITGWMIRKAAREATKTKISGIWIVGGLVAFTMLTIVGTFVLMQRETKKENAILHERLTKVQSGYVDLLSLTIEKGANSERADLLIDLSILKEGEYALKVEFAPPVRHFKVESPVLTEETALSPVKTFSARPGLLRVRGQVDISRLLKALTESELTLQSMDVFVKTGTVITNSDIPGFQLVYSRKDPISWRKITSSAEYKQSLHAYELKQLGPVEAGNKGLLPSSDHSNGWVARLCKEKLKALNDASDFQGVGFEKQTVKVSTFLWLIADVGLVGILLDAPESYLRELSVVLDSGEQFPAQPVDSPGCASRVRVVRYPNVTAEIGAKRNLKVHPQARMPAKIIAFY